MADMEELFRNLFDDEAEKTASDQEISEADAISKVASDLTEEDIVEAEALLDGFEQEKQADDYTTLGRFMARGFYDELNKMAAGADMVGMTGNALNLPGAPGNKTIAKGGDTSPGASSGEPGPKAPDSEGQSYTTPQDGSTVLKKIRSSIDAIHQPTSATKQQDAMGALRKIVDAAKQQRTKQHPTEVPSNLA